MDIEPGERRNGHMGVNLEALLTNCRQSPHLPALRHAVDIVVLRNSVRRPDTRARQGAFQRSFIPLIERMGTKVTLELPGAELNSQPHELWSAAAVPEDSQRVFDLLRTMPQAKSGAFFTERVLIPPHQPRLLTEPNAP